MSHPSSPSVLTNLINSSATMIPLFGKMGGLMSDLAARFDYANREDNTRFASCLIATMMAAGTTWGLQFAMSRIPIHFVRKTLLPIAEWTVKAGLSWVIFRALNSAVADRNGLPPVRSSEDPGHSPTRHDRRTDPDKRRDKATSYTYA